MVYRKHKIFHGFVRICATAAMLTVMLPIGFALAEDPSTQSQKQADQLAQEIEQSTKTYQDATAAVDDIAAQIAESEERIAELEQDLPAQRENAAASIKQLYIFQQTSPDLLELMFSADDFDDFITALQYMTVIHDHNAIQVNALQAMHDDLTQSKALLSAELDAAKEKQDEAIMALDGIRSSLSDLRMQSRAQKKSDKNSDAQATSDALQRAEQAVATLPESVAEAVSQPTERELQQIEREQAEEQAAAERLEVARAQDSPEPLLLEEDPETNEEIDSWASRIDAYLSSYGAPMAGYGDVFARAAAEYGVDPRIAPAIAVIESGGGKVCFKPHNAWGWGTTGWSSWDEAIKEYISGFSRLYGPTLTREGAKAYASIDTWETWYNLLHSEMASI